MTTRIKSPAGSPANYDKRPSIPVGSRQDIARGWDEVCTRLRDGAPRVVVVETFPGVLDQDIAAIAGRLHPDLFVSSAEALRPPGDIDAMVMPELTNDPVFGRITQLRLEDFFDPVRLERLRRQVAETTGTVLVCGPGASLVSRGDVLVLAEMPRWETQLRQRQGQVHNLGAANHGAHPGQQYKRSFFVDWRVCDRHKRDLWEDIDFFLDTTHGDDPKLVAAAAMNRGLASAARRPFRVVPYFDPAPWGGQWMKEVCDLDRAVSNFGWCFDCVPEENSLLLDFGGACFETPAANLVFQQAAALLGERVHQRFGAEFPIRFDFLDTMGGGNLSLQVHPLTEYIKSNFGIGYTQDESYYMLDAGQDATVFLGLREGVDRRAMAADLRRAQRGGYSFPAESYVNRFPARRHDHFLIPAGTVHCSGANAMVLEISATPYIFTFKLWDWDRMGLDGRPRPIHLDHGLNNIQWDRDTAFARRELVNQVERLSEGDGWVEERTGLHALEFIETRRHWFRHTVTHARSGSVEVLNLVQGREAVVESPDRAFDPFVVHYAETFIVPAAAGEYTIRPLGDPGDEDPHGTIKAFVRAAPSAFTR